MAIEGFMKMTLLDYPGCVASTIFYGGCNFFCPFCHNKDLVIPQNRQKNVTFSTNDILLYLKKKKNILDGVCISGGEPTLQPDLIPFLEQIKELGLLIKLDTNGSNPELLSHLCREKRIDYVAMDIKHSLNKYPLIINAPNFDLKKIERSVDFLKENSIPYEFRTTVISEFHTANDFVEIAKWLNGASSYVLQPYKDSDTVISPGFLPPTAEHLLEYVEILQEKIKKVTIRGVDL